MNPLLSVVTPAFNEASNLPELYRSLTVALEGVDWEWIVVDDHSKDDTFSVLSGLAKSDPRVHGLRLAQNAGSHAAILCGLTRAHGDAVTMLAADLQDPPETLPKLLGAWRQGARIVWAVRTGPPPDQSFTDRMLSRLYHATVKLIADPGKVLPEGVSFFLIDRVVIEGIRSAGGMGASLFLLLARLDFPKASVTFEKQARRSGRSGWTLRKKIALGIGTVLELVGEPRKRSPVRCLIERTTDAAVGSI